MRRSVARAFRRAVISTLVLAALALVIAAAASVERTEANAAASTTERPVVTMVAVPAAAPEQTSTAAPPVELSSSSVDVAPALSAVATSVEPGRRVRTAGRQEVAGQPPQALSAEDRDQALIDRAAASRDAPVIAELSFVVSEGNAGSPALDPGDIIVATVSFYYCERGDAPDGGDGGGFCGPMRDGTVVYEGAAACAFPYLGQRFRIVGDPTERIYTCHDTGSAVHGLHRDIFFYYAADGWPWLNSVGMQVVLEIVD